VVRHNVASKKLSASFKQETAVAAATIFGDYRSEASVYDESVLAPGTPRPHWQNFISALEKLGREELALRWENGRRIIREHGVTYNVYGDPQGMDRPWELDMLPLLLPRSEWLSIEAGLSQRTKLFNLILADLYGQQRLLRDGLIPPALVFANPGFLRACHGLRVPGEIYVHLHAVDLARAPDGQWWALGDRTQSPSGSGYALENRIVLSRIFPDEFHNSQVQRLASFFRILRDTLRSLAPNRSDNPNVVLLTPGPHNETYFEHAYLARYLGFTLVEGGDLTVRGRCVFLKTLEGLQPVDVIFRRVDDTFCDPLELRSDSFLGVPGLVEAARAGNVSLANSLGAGLIESPAFLAFLPNLCRHLLGEELKLPSVATWWCGQAKEQEYVLEHLDDIVVKAAITTQARKPSFGGRLSITEREELVAAIRARPFEFVGQEQVALSTVPMWLNDKPEPRRVSVRAFVATNGDSFTVMPGGLTRVSPAAADPVVSMQSGGGSKDTWILSDGVVSPVSLLTPSGQPVSIARGAGGLPSRVADNLYWLGRYAERLEDTLRVLRCIIVRMTDEASSDKSPELTALAQAMVHLKMLPPEFFGRVLLKDLEQEILQLIYNPQRTGSVRALVRQIRIIASVVRDRFSTDTWRLLNELQLDARTRRGQIPLTDALALLNTLIVDLAAFSGLEMENMTRGHGWRFLDFGRRLERGANLIGVVRAALSPEIKTELVLEPLLEIADSSMTYRRRYFAQARLAPVLDLLLVDASNPRSLAFQLGALTEHTANLPRNPRAPAVLAEQRRLAHLTATLRAADLTALAASREAGDAAAISGWLDELLAGLSALSDELTHFYFTLTVARVS
jgi:uncharacterized circularly permuted ATP-grasp superfamily protein/uncharacterized alpha-E superfamily protein